MKTKKPLKYRLNFICCLANNDLGWERVPLANGLAIEKLDHMENNMPVYIVILMLKYDKANETVHIAPVDTRLLDVDKSDWNEVKRLIRTGIEEIVDANEERKRIDKINLDKIKK